MKDYPSNPPTPLEMKFRTKVKEFFFCDEDENLHWSGIAWMVAGGVLILWVVLLVAMAS